MRGGCPPSRTPSPSHACPGTHVAARRLHGGRNWRTDRQAEARTPSVRLYLWDDTIACLVNLRRACWIRPVAHLFQQRAFTVSNGILNRSPQYHS